jgi:hypothetical protein
VVRGERSSLGPPPTPRGNPVRSRAVPILLLVTLLLPGCAVGEEPTPSSGTGLQPRLSPETKKAGRPNAARGSAKGRSEVRNDRPKGGVTPPPKKSEGSSQEDASPTGPGPTTAAPTPTPAGPQTASVRDRSGDAQGLRVPAYADLTSATLRRDGSRYTLTVTAAGAFPATSDDVVHVICFVDVDGDGQVDYELWGTAADNGWSGTWRYPDGAKFGSASGVSVQPSGRDLVLAFDSSRLGRAASFRWLVGAEQGTVEQQATGTLSEDYAPDQGAVRFPG